MGGPHHFRLPRFARALYRSTAAPCGFRHSSAPLGRVLDILNARGILYALLRDGSLFEPMVSVPGSGAGGTRRSSKPETHAAT